MSSAFGSALSSAFSSCLLFDFLCDCCSYFVGTGSNSLITSIAVFWVYVSRFQPEKHNEAIRAHSP